MSIYQTTHDYCRRLSYNLEKMMNVKLSIAIGECCLDAADLPHLYQACRKLLANKLFDGRGQIYSIQESRETAPSEQKPPESLHLAVEKIASNLRQADSQYREETHDLFAALRAGRYPIEEIDAHLISLLHAGFQVAQEQELQTVTDKYSFHSLYQQLQEAEVLTEMEEIVLTFFDDVSQTIEARQRMRRQEFNELTIRTLEYIECNYMHPISLQSIADELGVHPAYLSRVFKADTGENFVEYINRRRIEKAKELIETHQYKVKEIYGRVGFNQYNYFFKVFRDITGLTPTEYRRRIAKY